MDLLVIHLTISSRVNAQGPLFQLILCAQLRAMVVLTMTVDEHQTDCSSEVPFFRFPNAMVSARRLTMLNTSLYAAHVRRSATFIGISSIWVE